MRRLLLLVVALGTALVAINCGAADAPADAGDDSSQAEGIDVHGHWHIAIYDEDGTLDREYAFENALRGGDELLSRLLTVHFDANGDVLPTYPTEWAVMFGDTDIPDPGGLVAGVSPCDVDITYLATGNAANRNPLLSTGCALWAPEGARTDTYTSGVLTVEAIDSGVRLSGAATASQDGTIDYVETWMTLDHEYPSVGSILDAFTGTLVGPYADIQTGQTIQVQVDITFETPPTPTPTP